MGDQSSLGYTCSQTEHSRTEHLLLVSVSTYLNYHSNPKKHTFTFSASQMAPRFFKIILQENLQSNNLVLPTKFTMEYQNELSDTAKLSVSDGRVWKLELRREHGISLNDGFREFADYYSLSHGHWLVFKYKGSSRFTVHIFDKSSCEISYPPNSRKDKRAGVRGKAKTHCKYTSKCGITTPRHFKSRRPFFEVKLKEYNFSLNIVYVPPEEAETIRKAQVKNQSVWVEVGDGRRWKVSLLKRNTGRVSLGKMKAFHSENGLKENDICIFEVIKNNLLKVYIFSALY